MIDDPRLPWQRPVVVRADKLEGGTVLNIHNVKACEGGPCTMHARTAHPLRDHPQFYDAASAAMFRVCSHRRFHVDPDERERVRRREACRNCCGCCE